MGDFGILWVISDGSFSLCFGTCGALLPSFRRGIVVDMRWSLEGCSSLRDSCFFFRSSSYGSNSEA